MCLWSEVIYALLTVAVASRHILAEGLVSWLDHEKHVQTDAASAAAAAAAKSPATFLHRLMIEDALYGGQAVSGKIQK